MKQINFARQWSRIAPWLNERDVKLALTFGLTIQYPNYRPGDPPWRQGDGPRKGQRGIPGKLSWYQPWRGCHSIAPFAWAISKRLHPEFTWGLLSSERHTVAVGLNPQDKIKCVADILLFKSLTAEQSIAFVESQPTSLCFNPGELSTGEGWAKGWHRLFPQLGVDSTDEKPVAK